VKHRADKPPPGSNGESLTNRLGLMKKYTVKEFSRASLKSRCQSFHPPPQIPSLTPQNTANCPNKISNLEATKSRPGAIPHPARSVPAVAI
jgi:hypothetical protein